MSEPESANIATTDLTVEEYEANKAAHVQDVHMRNHPSSHKPARPLRLWRVSHPAIDANRPGTVEAPNEDDAFAIFCDVHKNYPGPKFRRVELVQ